MCFLSQNRKNNDVIGGILGQFLAQISNALNELVSETSGLKFSYSILVAIPLPGQSFTIFATGTRETLESVLFQLFQLKQQSKQMHGTTGLSFHLIIFLLLPWCTSEKLQRKSEMN